MTETTIGYVLNSILQLGLFSLIPFLWWLIFARKKEKFFKWIGLIKPCQENRALIFLIIFGLLGLGFGSLILLVAIPILWCFTGREESFLDWLGLKTITARYKSATLIFVGVLIVGGLVEYSSIFGIEDVGNIITEFDGFVAGDLYGIGAIGIIYAFFFAFIKTGLSEEILFRGFIGKRASALLGFTAGNLVQGVIFGLLHGVPAFIITGDPLFAIWVTIATSSTGVLFGYLMKVSGGSIILCWLVHGVGNFIPAVAEAFMLR